MPKTLIGDAVVGNVAVATIGDAAVGFVVADLADNFCHRRRLIFIVFVVGFAADDFGLVSLLLSLGDNAGYCGGPAA